MRARNIPPTPHWCCYNRDARARNVNARDGRQTQGDNERRPSGGEHPRSKLFRCDGTVVAPPARSIGRPGKLLRSRLIGSGRERAGSSRSPCTRRRTRQSSCTRDHTQENETTHTVRAARRDDEPGRERRVSRAHVGEAGGGRGSDHHPHHPGGAPRRFRATRVVRSGGRGGARRTREGDPCATRGWRAARLTGSRGDDDSTEHRSGRDAKNTRRVRPRREEHATGPAATRRRRDRSGRDAKTTRHGSRAAGGRCLWRDGCSSVTRVARAARGRPKPTSNSILKASVDMVGHEKRRGKIM